MISAVMGTAMDQFASQLYQRLLAAPPLITAALAIGFVMVWQLVGVTLLTPLLARARTWPAGLATALAWLLWLPLLGSVGELLALGGWCHTAVVRGAMLAILVAAVTVAVRKVGSPPGDRVVRSGVGSRSYWFGAAMAVAISLQVLELAFAAHPQRLYDQLSYHLVIAKRALTFGSPWVQAYDPHLLIAGPVEYAFIWPRAILGADAGDLFVTAAAQAWIYVASVGSCLLAAAALLKAMVPDRRSRRVALVVLTAALPAMLPNGELVQIAKPGALLFAGAFITFLASDVVGSSFVLFAGALAAAMVGLNPTYVHVALALLPLLVVEGLGEWRRQGAAPWLLAAWRSVWPLAVVGGIILGASMLRSFVGTRTLLYPADAPYLGSPAADAETFAYWRFIAFSTGEPIWARLAGAWDVAVRGPAIAVWLLTVGWVALVQARREPHAQASAPALWRIVRRLLWFVVAYAMLWPVFYDSAIYTRFVAGYVAALLLLAWVATIALRPGPSQRVLWVLAFAGALAVSSADELARKMGRWNSQSLVAAFRDQFPRYDVATAVNAVVGERDTVLSDGPEKLFFRGASLCGAIAPGERRVWDDLARAPQASAQRYRVGAVVIEAWQEGRPDNHRPYVGPIYQVFDALRPFGEVQRLGGDLLLTSSCYFVARPCPPHRS